MNMIVKKLKHIQGVFENQVDRNHMMNWYHG